LVDLIPERVDPSIRRRHNVQYSICYDCQFEVDAASGVSRGRRSRGRSDEVETPSALQKNGLEASLKIGRDSDKYEVAVVAPRMHS